MYPTRSAYRHCIFCISDTVLGTRNATVKTKVFWSLLRGGEAIKMIITIQGTFATMNKMCNHLISEK